MRRIAHITALLLLLGNLFGGFITEKVYAQNTKGNDQVRNAASSSTCDTISDPAEKQRCNSCMGSDTNTGTWTAIGCISTDPNSLLEKFLGLATGVSGGIAFLLILFGGFQIMTSAGNPEQLNAGRELVSSAITGLLLILFSVFILQFVGVNIIGIPGFG